MSTIHEPVLLREVLFYLDPTPGENFVDCTYGAGGHSASILEKIKPNGKLIGIDWDPVAALKIKNKNLVIVNDNYKNLIRILNDSGVNKINGILLDLGLSSDQLSAGNRGFGFESQGFFDLRYNPNSDRPTAREVLSNYNQDELFYIFREYGEEPLAKTIAQKIITNRQKGQVIETAEMLVQLVSEIYQKKFKKPSRKNPATRVFQALRIAVNDEFNNITNVLPDAVEILKKGGRLVVVSFHSGEDRIVKHFFRDWAKKGRISILTKKPIMASEDELIANPRSRSAKLRAIEKIK